MDINVYAAVVLAFVCIKDNRTDAPECQDLSAVYLAEKPFVQDAYVTSGFNKRVCNQLKRNTWNTIAKSFPKGFKVRDMSCIFSAEAYLNEFLNKKLRGE